MLRTGRRMERHLSECSSAVSTGSPWREPSILGAIAAEPPSRFPRPDRSGRTWMLASAGIMRPSGRRGWEPSGDACPEEVRTAADRLYRGWEEVQAQLPIRMAWAYDSARECLDARLWVQSAARDFSRGLSPSFDAPEAGDRPGAGGPGAALVLPAVHRHRAGPRPRLRSMPPRFPARSSRRPAAGRHGRRRPCAPSPIRARADSLAQADPRRPPMSRPRGRDRGGSARTAVTTPTASRYDLETASRRHPIRAGQTGLLIPWLAP